MTTAGPVYLSVGLFPDRKRPALALVDGSVIHVLAYFRNEESADRFMELVKGGRLVYRP